MFPMNFDNTNAPRCMNLYNIELNNGYFNIKLESFYINFFNVDKSNFGSTCAAFSDGSKLLNCLTKQIALKINCTTNPYIQVDLKNDLLNSKDSENLFDYCNFRKKFKINFEEINLDQMKQISNAINIIFSTAGCKGEEIQKDELCYVNLTWENKNFLTPKFEISNSNKTSQENFNQLREDNLLFDGVIVVENQSIPIHRCLLAVKSSVFLQMFKNEWAKDNKISFPDETLKTIQLFLDYLYQDYTIVTNDLDEMLALTKFAHRYDLKSLFDACVSLLHKEIMDFENIIDIYLFGEQLGSKEIIEKCEHKSILLNWIPDKPSIDVSSITDLTALLKIYQIAKKLKLQEYMNSIKDQLLLMAQNPDQFDKMKQIAKQLELEDLMETINQI